MWCTNARIMRIIIVLVVVACWSQCHAALQDVMGDCCGRGQSFARMGRSCDDPDNIPDIVDMEDHHACMVIMKSCCSSTLQPLLCERATRHRMNVGSCHTMGNDTCLTLEKECCDCCELGMSAYLSGMSCDSMATGTPCDEAFNQCCRQAMRSQDSDECGIKTSHTLCTERCVNLVGNYVCECHEGNRLLEDNITCVSAADTRGAVTQRPPLPSILSCDRAPCQHQCRQVGRFYECFCNTGYELMEDGYSCNDIDECAQSHAVVCSYAERCYNTIGSYTCRGDVVCRQGLRYDTVNQYCVDIDECAEGTDNCDEQSICENRYGRYDCRPARCPQGYYYDRPSRRCLDVDECSRGTHNCQGGFRCDNLEGSFTCTRIQPCGTGYTIDGITQECVDVDECSQGNHNCQSNERCNNVRGSYRCEQCPRGFQVDFNNMCLEDIDECRTGAFHCNEGKRCENNHGGYRCVSVCMEGFEYSRARQACLDIDECTRGHATCQIYEVCQNLNGSFSCGCRRGFRTNSYGECVDIDECREGTSQCLPNQRCHNNQGQYQCRNVCRTGFRYNRLRSTCEDVDECAEGLHACQDNQRCINQEGGYVCQCPSGHQANRERGTCEDIDECRLGLCRGTCENIPGSYLCTCPSGYSLMENKVTCKDVDECDLGTDSCIGDEVCFNTRGGYKCESIRCPRYYELRQSTEIQCVKQCPLNVPDCEPNSNLNGTITHTFVALPSISFLRQPIRLLTIALPNYRNAFGLETQTYFNLLSGNEENYFSIARFLPQGLPTGYLSLQRPIQGPYETVLSLQIVTEVRNALTRRTEITASSFLMIHIDVGEQSY